MAFPKLNSLNARIFAIFWLTICIVLLAVISLPHLDPRKSRPLGPHQMERLITFKDRIENRFADQPLPTTLLQLQMIRRMGHGPEKDRLLYFLTDLDGNVLNAPDDNDFKMRAIRNFVSSIDDISNPQERQYGKYLISGPIQVHLANQNLLLFAGFKGDEPSAFLLGLFDKPFTLLLTMMLVSTPFLLWLAWALSQPANRLGKAAQRVAQGQFEVDRELERGPNEFRQAGRSFNQMVEAVNGMISGQQRLLSDISHELRSPLTRLRMANALATRKLGSSSELERIDTEAQRLEQMISELLELSRMQVDSHLHRENQPMSSLWQELLEDAQFEAEQMKKNLTFTPIPERIISGNPKLLMSAVENIVRNAIYYGKDQIKVTMKESDNQLTINVEDNGDGVPEAELKEIFRPFYRVSTARDRHSGGTGLGLAITDSAVRQHSGTIEASRSSMGGLKVSITLPLPHQTRK